MILKLFLFIFCWLYPVLVDCDYIYVRHMSCNYSEEFVYKNYSCFAKSYTRKLSTINYVVRFKKPINNFLSETRILYRYGLIYREVLAFKKLNWCKLMDGATENIMYTYLFQEFRNDGMGHMLHKCPYKDFNVRNVSLDVSPIIANLATGEYKILVDLLNADEKLIGNMKLLAIITTPNKDTFG